MKITVATIVWVDACIYGSGSQAKEDVEAYGLMRGVTSGILVKEDSEKITLAMDSFPTYETYRTVQTYPKVCIKKMFKNKIEAKL